MSVFSLFAIDIVLLFTLASRSPSCSCILVAKYISKSCSRAVGLPGDHVLPLEASMRSLPGEEDLGLPVFGSFSDKS